MTFFEFANIKTEYNVESSDKKKIIWNAKPTLESLKKDFGLENVISDFTIESSKLYYREGGYLPADKVKAEMDLARENPTSHIPSTLEAFEFFVLNFYIPVDNKVVVRHSFMEICTKAIDN